MLNKPELTPEQFSNTTSYFIAIHYWEEMENRDVQNPQATSQQLSKAVLAPWAPAAFSSDCLREILLLHWTTFPVRDLFPTEKPMGTRQQAEKPTLQNRIHADLPAGPGAGGGSLLRKDFTPCSLTASFEGV